MVFDVASIAFMLGARIFEKHFTLDRSWKGTPFIFIRAARFKKMIRNLNRISVMLGSSQKKLLKSEINLCIKCKNLLLHPKI